MIRLALGLLVGGGLGALMGYFGQCASGTCPLTATPLRGAVFGALLGVLFSFSVTSRNAGSSTSLARLIDDSSQFQELVLESQRPVLVFFHSDQCPSCRRLSPIMDEVAALYEGRLKIYKVDIDRSRGIAEPYKVEAIPLVILFVEGRETERLVGLRRTTEFSRMIEHYLENRD